MLNSRPHARRHQRGLVLVLALIVLAAMSLAAIGLMRGVLGSNRVAGNLAYQQAAVQAADTGVETAVAWLEQQARATVAAATAGSPPVSGNTLWANMSKSSGAAYNYVATRSDPAAGQTWENFWQTLVGANQVNSLSTDATGNTVSFVIHRLCAVAGAPDLSQCETSPSQGGAPNGAKRRDPAPKQMGAVYYRITVKVQGPRNATSFIQAMIAI